MHAEDKPKDAKPTDTFSKMTTIRPAVLQDVPKIRELVVALKRHHVDVGDEIDLTLEELQEYFRQNCFTGLMLIKNPEKGKPETEADKIGCMVTLPDVSPRISSFGTDLDQFFVEEAYRNGGCGSKMLKKLCQRLIKDNESHIKIVFQSGLNLESFYTRHGFKNITINPPGIHLVKLEGRERVREFMNRELNGEATNGNGAVMTVVPFTEITTIKNSLYPTWKKPIPKAFMSEAVGKPYPSPQVVTLSVNQPSNGTVNGGSNSKTPGLCMFTEQAAIFSWFGVRLSFIDIVGDCRLITFPVIQERLRFWIDHSSSIDILEIEVPFLSAEGEVLTRSLQQMGLEDTAVKEGFNVGLLEFSALKELASKAN